MNGADQDRPKRAEPLKFRGRKLSVVLNVTDVETSLAWYRDVMEFHVADTDEREGELWGARLLAGNVEITLTQDDGSRDTDSGRGIGVTFQITTVQDVDELARRIQARGGTLEGEPEDLPWGRHFRIRDPDGFVYGIVGRPGG